MAAGGAQALVKLADLLVVPSVPPSAQTSPLPSPREPARGLVDPAGGAAATGPEQAGALVVASMVERLERPRPTYLKGLSRRHESAPEPPEVGAEDDVFAEDGGRKLATVAVQGLRNLSQTAGLRPHLMRVAVRSVLRCAKMGSAAGEDLLTQCAALLANLSEVPGHREALVHRCLGVPALVALARTPSRDARLDASRALANLSCCEENHETIYDQVTPLPGLGPLQWAGASLADALFLVAGQGGLGTLVDLVVAGRDAHDDAAVHFGDASVTETYAAMALRFLIVHPVVTAAGAVVPCCPLWPHP